MPEREVTLMDASTLLHRRFKSPKEVQQWFADASVVFDRHPLAYLKNVIRYAVQLHSDLLFPFQRAFSEAFLAVPESEILPAQSGGGTFWARRRHRKANAIKYADHFRRVLVKFALAIGAHKTLTLLQPKTVGGGLREMVLTQSTATELDDALHGIVAPFYSREEVSHADVKKMQLQITRGLTRLLRGHLLVGRYNDRTVRFNVGLTDSFYMTMCFAVVCVGQENLESARFIRMYQNTTAYVSFVNYKMLNPQYSFVDSENPYLLTFPADEYIMFFSLIGSNLCKHAAGNSNVSKIEVALRIAVHAFDFVMIAVLLAVVIGATQGGALVPLLGYLGIKAPAIVQRIDSVFVRIARVQKLVFQIVKNARFVGKKWRVTPGK